jgi:class 3 adenylate cyclase
MDPVGLKRRLTCILATDAVDYSRLVNQDETGALRILAAHRAVIDGIIAYHDGRIANTAGDSVLAEFGSVVEGVRAAVEIQDALKTRNESLPESQRMLFRIGINLGEVVVKGNDLLGDGVNVAARLQSIAPPGGILVSSSVYDQITGKLDLGFQDMGEQELKNISRPIRAFSVSGAGGTVQTMPPLAKPGVPAPRRLGPIAIVAIVALSIGALLAVTQGWLRPTAPEPRVDVARAKLEAELAAAEKARLEAEQRVKDAAAETARVRAESDAAALRAKAEADAAATKAKAASDAAAMRAQAAAEANRAKVAAPPPPVAAPVAPPTKEAVPPAKAALAPTSYDGPWNVHQQCAALPGSPAFKRDTPIVVLGGEFFIQRGKPGEPGSGSLRGKPEPDGTLVLTGTGISGIQGSYGNPFNSRFEGAWTGDRFRLKGLIGSRPCLFELSRQN